VVVTIFNRRGRPIDATHATASEDYSIRFSMENSKSKNQFQPPETKLLFHFQAQ